MVKTMEKALFGVLMVLILGIGSVFVSAAATNTNPMDWVSSIRVADSGNDNTPGISEAEESAQLAPLAKITQDEAISAAMNSRSGNYIAAELDNENGNVVYSIEMDNNGEIFDVKVDAGTGKVLKVESDNEDGPEEKEGAETESEEDSDFEQDGIDHQFEGDEGDHED